MEAPSATVLNLPCARLDVPGASVWLREHLGQRGGLVSLVNAATLAEGLKSPEFAAAIGRSVLPLPDGVGVTWVARALGLDWRHRCPGPDLLDAWLATDPTRSQVLAGGSVAGFQRLVKRYGLTRTVHVDLPFRPFRAEFAREDWALVKEKWTQAGHEGEPELVWVGIGSPKQELWADSLREVAPRTLFVGIGAAVDFLSGSKKRAPEWMRALGLEWMHRLLSEPKRLWRRYVLGTWVLARAVIAARRSQRS